MRIESFINARELAKQTNFEQEQSVIKSQIADDIVLHQIQTYLNDLDVNIATVPAKAIEQLSATCQLTCICEPTIQPIYGFKELQVPTDLSVSTEADANVVRSLSNIYQQSFQSVENLYGLSAIYPLETWKNQFLKADFNFFAQHNLKGSVLKAADLQASLYELMNMLSHIRKFKYNVYFKKTFFTGGMTMYTCFCSLQDGEIFFDPYNPPNAKAVNDALAALLFEKYELIGKILKEGEVKTRMPYSWRIYVSPFSKQIGVEPNYDGEHGSSNSACRIAVRNTNVSNETATGLAYVKDESSDEPTFDMSSIDGSNGICTAYKLVKSQYFDLRSAIDLEKMFGIAPGKRIAAERVISAITYIFELWQKNLKTIQYDIYCCHYNCHANSLGNVAEPQLDYDTYNIVINDKMSQIDGVFEYTLPENAVEYYLDKDTSRPEHITFIGNVFDFGVDETKDPKEGWYQRVEDGPRKIAKDGYMVVKNKNQYMWSDLHTQWTIFNKETVEIALPMVTSTAPNAEVTAVFSFEYGGSVRPDPWPANSIPTTQTLDIANDGMHGTLTVTYTVNGISNISINGLWKIQAIPAQPYTGSSVVPAIVVQTLKGTVVNTSDYTAVCTNNVDPGIANVKVTGRGIYVGSIETTFQIVKQQRNISNATIAAISDQEYTGSALTPSLTVTYNEIILVAGTDYNTSYSNNTNIGTATVTITGTNSTASGHDSYFGTKSTTFRIVKNISKSEIADIPDQTYTGSPINPTLTVTQDGQTLTNGTHYTVEYTNNTEVGTATATITGIGWYFGTKSKDFNIVEAPSG